MSTKMMKIGGSTPQGVAAGIKTDEFGNVSVSNFSEIQKIIGNIPEPHDLDYTGPIAVFGRKVISKKPHNNNRTGYVLNAVQREGNNYYLSNGSGNFDVYNQAGSYEKTTVLGNIGAVFFEGFAYSINAAEGKLEKARISDIADKAGVDILQYGELGNVTGVVHMFIDKAKGLVFTNIVEGKLLCFKCSDLTEVYNISLSAEDINYRRPAGITQDDEHMYICYFAQITVGGIVIKVRLADLSDEAALNSNSKVVEGPSNSTVTNLFFNYPSVLSKGVLGFSSYDGLKAYVVDTVSGTTKFVAIGEGAVGGSGYTLGSSTVATALGGELFFCGRSSVITMDSDANITSVTQLEEDEQPVSITQDAFQNIVVVTDKNFYILSAELHIRGYKLVV